MKIMHTIVDLPCCLQHPIIREVRKMETRCCGQIVSDILRRILLPERFPFFVVGNSERLGRATGDRHDFVSPNDEVQFLTAVKNDADLIAVKPDWTNSLEMKLLIVQKLIT